ncbi:MAG: hypothetical protein EBY17_27540, partial [Acidobacteriia bacterium]|nr:hypothetical protein [Terriglobia bacterium]
MGVPGLDLSSLAGYYQFDDPTNLGKDSSGRNNDLQVFGTGVTYTAAGRTGGGLLLSAQGGLTTSDHTVPTGFPLGSSPYTISVDFKTTSVGNKGFIGWGAWGSGLAVNALRTANSGIVNYWWGVDLGVDPGNATDGTFHNATVTYDGTTRSIYYDKVLAAQDTPGCCLAVQNLNFAIGTTNTSEYFNGTLDNVAVFNSALTTAQIQQSRGGISVTIGGVPATGVAVSNNSTLSAVTPPGTAGAQDVVVTTPGGSATLSSGFRYLASQNITFGPLSDVVFGITPELVAQYKFQDSSRLGLDSTTNGNDTAVNGTVTQGTGPFQGWNSAVMSGNGVLKRLTALNSFDLAKGYSYTAWVKLASVGGYAGLISQDTGGCCFNRWMLTSGAVYLDVGGHNDMSVAGPAQPQNTWMFMALTAGNEAINNGNATARVYMNGSAVSGSPANFGHPLANPPGVLGTYLGAGEGGNGYNLNGELADVRIYNSVLTASAISQIYQSQSSVGGNTVTLAATGGSSGNAVSFAATTPAVCTVTGTTVTLV